MDDLRPELRRARLHAHARRPAGRLLARVLRGRQRSGDWLRGQLAILPTGACVLAYWHHPRLSSGFGGAYQAHPETDPLVAALREYDAELILTGHSHNYERFDLGAGLTQFVVGTGGRDLHAATGQPPLTTTLRTDAFGCSS